MRRKPSTQSPLYVRLPSNAVDKLDRASAALGMHKKDIVAGLITKYIDPDSQRGLSALSSLSRPRASDTLERSPMIGSYAFQPYDLPEIMNAEQAALFLQIDPRNVIELAEAEKLPGKRLGSDWRFSRAALVAWLSTPEVAKR